MRKNRAFVTKMLKIARFGTKFFISRKTFFIFVITEEKSSTNPLGSHAFAVQKVSPYTW
jgi:hypothetical protein